MQKFMQLGLLLLLVLTLSSVAEAQFFQRNVVRGPFGFPRQVQVTRSAGFVPAGFVAQGFVPHVAGFGVTSFGVPASFNTFNTFGVPGVRFNSFGVPFQTGFNTFSTFGQPVGFNSFNTFGVRSFGVPGTFGAFGTCF